ncbi:tyrosinase family protein [Caldithrix abyssi]|nr:tyrosinase family protein [Caldithrix abyssi]
MTTTERETYLEAVLTLKNTIANPAAPLAQQYSIWDEFVLIHLSIQDLTHPYSGVAVDGAHGFFHFLPWHRKFLLELENALNTALPGNDIGIPYWDWPDVAGLWSDILVDGAFGPNGTGASDVVQTGYFAPTAPGALPPWWPAGLAGWDILFNGALNSSLVRNINPAASLPSQAQVQDLLLDPDFFAFTDINNPATYTGLWWKLEGGPHNAGHNWFNSAGGFNVAHMGHMFLSVNDPMFFLHHSNVDRLWAMWQIDGHAGSGPYTASGVSIAAGYGHLTTHALFPWVGGTAGFSSPISSDASIDFPDFSADPVTTIGDMLNHRALGYSYDTEPVVGLALDRSGSMVGVTPDPATGLPSAMTKWTVASTGLSNFLGDCEAARLAGEVFVVAGVETFRRSGGSNEFDKLFSPSTGVVSSAVGASVSQSVFNTAILALSPSGGTPIAGALSDTETTLVRAPYSGAPSGETRYLYILTDGNETAAPLLSTLAEPEFPDTIIFAAGFGVGGGWDGVDYSTITNIVDKGKGAPLGVDQVFHGENANVINKFYTNGVAHAIGYDPIVDPYAELAASEFMTVPFAVSAADRSFMIVINGAPNDGDSWNYLLADSHNNFFDDTSAGSFLITARRSGGRITIFFHRNASADADWNGNWNLIVGYKREVLPRNSKEFRIGLNTYDPLIHSAAPLPLGGPRYSVTKGARRVIKKPRNVFMSLARPAFVGANIAPLGGEVDVAGVSVNIYAKTSIVSAAWAEVKQPYAGSTVYWNLDLDRHHRRKFEHVRVRAKVIRPDFHIGDAYRDLKTIPLKERQQFIDKKTSTFDEAAFLATYEQRQPGAFSYVAEDLVFERVNETRFVAKSVQTSFPGIYRLGLTAEGVDSGHSETQSKNFQRIHNAETSLGLRLNSRRSRATWHWLSKDSAEITVTPQDRLGHIASPAKMSAPELELNGKAVRTEHQNDYSGTHRLIIKFEAGKGPFVNKLGTSLSRSGVKIRLENGKRFSLGANEIIKPVLKIGNQRLSVLVPEYVAGRTSKITLPAFDSKILELNPDERIVFRSADDVLNHGFKIKGD